MDEPIRRENFKGDFSEQPFPFLLHELWEDRASGQLTVQRESGEDKWALSHGLIAWKADFFTAASFGRSLAAHGIVDTKAVEECAGQAVRQKCSLITVLIKKRLLLPAHLWPLMEEYAEEDLLPLFDLEEGSFVFDTKDVSAGAGAVVLLAVPELIRRGVDRMKNFRIIEKYTGTKNAAPLSVLPAGRNHTQLCSHEKYLLRMVEDLKNTDRVLKASEMGQEETQRILFALLSLGVLKFPNGPELNHENSVIAPPDLKAHMDCLNRKCAHIYKFMTKEIGPVAWKTLEKSINEVRNHLSPLFQDINFLPDGTFSVDPLLKKLMMPSGRKESRSALQDMNEILAAEVLTVKKILGEGKESKLIQSLEKNGDP